MKLLDGVRADATLSPDGTYRYALFRDWYPKERGSVLFIMLNPSTADAAVDDPTIRKCQKFARTWGYDGITVVNLYAYRATDPKKLRGILDPVGPENNEIISIFLEAPGIGLAVAAWGAEKMAQGRGLVIRYRAARAGRPLHVLELTKGECPRHPLYVKDERLPIEWPAPR